MEAENLCFENGEAILKLFKSCVAGILNRHWRLLRGKRQKCQEILVV